jgi:hypothetical protein
MRVERQSAWSRSARSFLTQWRATTGSVGEQHGRLPERERMLLWFVEEGPVSPVTCVFLA